MMFEIVVIATSALNIFFTITYIKNIFKGSTKPNKVTWFMWMLNSGIAFFLQLTKGVNFMALIPIFASFITCLMVLASSLIFKKGQYKLGQFDYICLFLSIIALVLWLVVNNPILALIFAIVSDMLSLIPTIKKTWLHPQTESVGTYYAGLISVGAGLVLLNQYNFISLAYPIYLILGNGLVIILAKRKPKLAVS